MKVYYDLEKQYKPTAVALGFFDGMHLGHQKIISKTIEYGSKDLTTCVFTFSQSPRAIVENHEIALLMTPEQKLSAIADRGIDVTYMQDFNSIRGVPPEKFVKEILFDVLNAKVVVCGFNYHFGIGGCANAEDLCRLCENYKIKVDVMSPVTYKNITISSTRIRNAIKNKEFKIAQDMIFGT